MNGEWLKIIAFMEKNQCMATVKEYPCNVQKNSQAFKFENLNGCTSLIKLETVAFIFMACNVQILLQ